MERHSVRYASRGSTGVASAVGAAEAPQWQAEVEANPQLMGPV